MKNISVYVVVLLMMVSFIIPTAPVEAKTNAEQIVELQAMLVKLQALLLQLQAAPSTVAKPVVATCTGKANLFVAEVSFDKEVLSGNSMGESLPEQLLKVRVMNDGCLSASAIGTKVNYTVTNYEAKSGSDPKAGSTSGSFTIASTTGAIATFDVSVTGGLSYEKDNFERDYYATVKIDTTNVIKESKESDNSMTTEEWVMEYYKG